MLLCFVVCYWVADAWLGVYDAAIEAIFLCFLADREESHPNPNFNPSPNFNPLTLTLTASRTSKPTQENDTDARPMYASASLRKYMELHRPTYRLPTEEVSPTQNGARSR